MQKSFCKTNLYIQYTRVLTIGVNPGPSWSWLHPLITRIIAFQGNFECLVTLQS